VDSESTVDAAIDYEKGSDESYYVTFVESGTGNDSENGENFCNDGHESESGDAHALENDFDSCFSRDLDNTMEQLQGIRYVR
jgi:hypothetical protein